MTSVTEPHTVRAPRGTTISCKGWQQEAALRMLMNNLDPEVAEHPEDLVVYGGTGRAARNWHAFDAIVRTLRDLEDDETLLIQSGKPVGVFRTHVWSPRVLLANSNLVGDWANWEKFRELEAAGLTMYGQMTAGSWIYIGTQGILQGTYETFGAVAKKKFNGTLAGTITLTAGVGGMGGAQPLAVTMNEGVAICVDCDESRIDRRIAHRYLDTKAADIDEALALAIEARDAKRPLSIGLVGNAADVFPELLDRDAPIDIVTDQTSAHDPLSYLPSGMLFEDMKKMADKDPVYFTEQARDSMAKHVKAMVGFMDKGAEVFDYGNSIRDEARKAGYDRAFDFPGFVPAYIRPQFEEGLGPFRWAALSGDPKDIEATDRAILELFPDNEHLRRWITMAEERVAYQGLPARICWLGYGERHRAGLKFNEMVASGELSAPIVIGRDHLDSGSVASPYRETEADGRRLRRHRRLAAAERLGEHRVGRIVGVDPPRWRRRYGPLHPRGPGVRGRRDGAGGAEAGTGARQRSRHGRHPARRRRLRARHRGRRRAGSSNSHAREVNMDFDGQFDSLWESILDVGREPATGGYRRFAWTTADLTLREWFTAEAQRRGMTVEEDRNGNMWAWWMPRRLERGPEGRIRHRISPRLGARRRCVRRAARRGVGVPCGRSRPCPRRRTRHPDRRGRVRRRGGCTVRRGLRRVAAEHRCADGRTRAWVARQRRNHAGRCAARRGSPSRAARRRRHSHRPGRRVRRASRRAGSGARGPGHDRLRSPRRSGRTADGISRFGGEANHAGTTRLVDRRDPMLPFASAVHAARVEAGRHDSVATFGKVRVSPNGANAIPSRVDAWLDARAADEATLAIVVEAIRSRGGAACQGRPRQPGVRCRVDHPHRRVPRCSASATAGGAVAIRRGSRASDRRGPRRRNTVGQGPDGNAVRAQPNRSVPFARGVRRDSRLSYRR